MKCSGDTGVGIESFNDINVGVDSEDVSDDDKTFSVGEVLEIDGDFKSGKLHGRGKITFSNYTYLKGFFKNGILHGFARYFDKKGRLTFLGNHRHGVPVDLCWMIIRGGGCVVGKVDQSGLLTGHNIIYLFPNFR